MLLEMPLPVRFGKGHLSPLQEGHISATAGDRSDFMAIVLQWHAVRQHTIFEGSTLYLLGTSGAW